MSISIGGAALVPQQLAAPQPAPDAAAPGERPDKAFVEPKYKPPGTGRVVDRSV